MPRVVTLSSTAHRTGRIPFDNLAASGHYFRWRAYGQSKLANLLFALELHRRLSAAKVDGRAWPPTRGYGGQPTCSCRPAARRPLVMKVCNAVIAQSEEMGALPTLSTRQPSPGLLGRDLRGPDGPGEHAGIPRSSSRAAGRVTRAARAGCGR